MRQFCTKLENRCVWIGCNCICHWHGHTFVIDERIIRLNKYIIIWNSISLVHTKFYFRRLVHFLLLSLFFWFITLFFLIDFHSLLFLLLLSEWFLLVTFLCVCYVIKFYLMLLFRLFSLFQNFVSFELILSVIESVTKVFSFLSKQHQSSPI